jgi:prevent-host-death family protein
MGCPRAGTPTGVPPPLQGPEARPRGGSSPSSPGGLDLVRPLVYRPFVATVNVHEAKTHLSRLLERVARGEEIVIARAGTPVARLVPVTRAQRMDQLLGIDQGRIWIADDFTAPLPEELLAGFEGRHADPA